MPHRRPVLRRRQKDRWIVRGEGPSAHGPRRREPGDRHRTATGPGNADRDSRSATHPDGRPRRRRAAERAQRRGVSGRLQPDAGPEPDRRDGTCVRHRERRRRRAQDLLGAARCSRRKCRREQAAGAPALVIATASPAFHKARARRAGRRRHPDLRWRPQPAEAWAPSRSPDAFLEGELGRLVPVFARSASTSVSTTSCGSTGFARWARKPDARTRAASTGVAYAVRATAGTGRPARPQVAHPLHERVAVLARHADVADQHVGALAPRSAASASRDRAAAAHARARAASSTRDQHSRDVGLVVDDEQAQPAQERAAPAASARPAAAGVGVGSCAGSRARGSATREGGAAADARRSRPSTRAAVELDEVAHDREAEPEAAVRARASPTSACRKRSNTCGRKSRAMPMPLSLHA